MDPDDVRYVTRRMLVESLVTQGYWCAGCGQVLEVGAAVLGIVSDNVSKDMAMCAMHAECLRASDTAVTFKRMAEWVAASYPDDRGRLKNTMRKAFTVVRR